MQSSENHEMSHYIEKVTFVVHKDFEKNVRSVYAPPYELSVFGLEEFDAYIHVFFVDKEVPAQFFKVHIQIQPQKIFQRGVYHDFFIFTRPPRFFYNLLQIVEPARQLSGLLHHTFPEYFKQSKLGRCVEVREEQHRKQELNDSDVTYVPNYEDWSVGVFQVEMMNAKARYED